MAEVGEMAAARASEGVAAVVHRRAWSAGRKPAAMVACKAARKGS